MLDKHTLRNPEGLYSLTLTAVDRVNIFTRRGFKQVVVDSLRYCQ